MWILQNLICLICPWGLAHWRRCGWWERGKSVRSTGPWAELLYTTPATSSWQMLGNHSFQCSGSGIPRCLFDPGSGTGKKSRSGSGMFIPNHISESLEINFWVQNTYILWCGSGSRIRNLFGPGYRMEISDPGSRINIPDPQHCYFFFHWTNIYNCSLDFPHHQRLHEGLGS